MRQSAITLLCLIGGIFLLVGLPFTAIGYFSYTSTTSFMQGAVTTNGTIVECRWHASSSSSSGSSRDQCEPTVRFRTQQGQEIEFTSNFSSSTMHENDEVSVSYRPANPHDARLSTFMALWFFPLIFGGIGGVLVLVALVLFTCAIFAIKRRRSPSPFYYSSNL